MIEFTVYGTPQTAGSKRGFPIRRKSGKVGVAMSDDNPRSRDWKNAVASEAADAMNGRNLLDGPLTLTVEFYVVRPKGDFGTGRNAGKLKSSAPKYPAKRPDVTKLLRAVEDAMTEIVWRDDAQVVTQTATKRYGSRACCHVSVEPAD